MLHSDHDYEEQTSLTVTDNMTLSAAIYRPTMTARGKLCQLIERFREDAAISDTPEEQMLLEFAADITTSLMRAFQNDEEN